MFALSTVSLLLASAALAIPSHQLRNHNEVAKRVEGHLSKRFYSPRVTWYPTNTGPDACTGRNHGDYDNIVALNIKDWNNNKNCGRKIKITANGVTAYGVIQDQCATCYNSGEIDLTKGLFLKFESLDKGVFTATWEYADGDSEEHEEPKTTKKATTSKATTKATTQKTTTTAKPTTLATTKVTTKDTPTPTTEKVKPASTKKVTTTTEKQQPTEVPEAPEAPAFAGDDEEEDEDCEEYEDEDEDEQEETEEPVKSPVKSTPSSTPVKSTPSSTPVKSTPSPTPVVVKTAPVIKVDSTPSSVEVPSVVSSSVPVPVTTLAPTSSDAALVNPAAVPTSTEQQDASGISGGISSDSNIGNGAASLNYNKVVPGVVALVFLAVQAL